MLRTLAEGLRKGSGSKQERREKAAKVCGSWFVVCGLWSCGLWFVGHDVNLISTTSRLAVD